MIFYIGGLSLKHFLNKLQIHKRTVYIKKTSKTKKFKKELGGNI